MRKSSIAAIILMVLAAALYADINIEGKLTHEFSAGPGESYSGSIIIQNNGEKREEVKIYQRDYSSEAGGVYNYPDPGTAPRSNADWITLSPKKFFIQAGESYTAYFTITIPEDQTLSGTYWSMMMVEAIPEQSPESSDYNPDEMSVGVQTVLRYGIRMISHINDSGTILPQIIAANLQNEEGKLHLVLDIKNAGTRLLRIDTWAEVYNADGDFIGKYPGDHLAVFPDSSIRFTLNLTDVPRGKYQTQVILDCGDDNVYGVPYNLDIK